MTITQELQFSVLSAPVAQTDRRSLSQAWFSALYSVKDPSRGKAPVKSNPGQKRQTVCRSSLVPPKEGVHRTTQSRSVAAQRRSPRVGISVERRAPRLPLTKRIEDFARQVRPQTASATFLLDGKLGRVGILIRCNGSRIRLMAICSESAKAEVATALTQAAYALASQGIALYSEARGIAC